MLKIFALIANKALKSSFKVVIFNILSLKSLNLKEKAGRKSAFSLIELSIVILIISILAAGAMSVSTVALQNAKIKTTNERMAVIYKAIGGFVAQNYRLPCPASLKEAKSDAGYGAEQGAGNCGTTGDGIYTSTREADLVYGMVPVKALGLSDEMAEDGFGSKIAYIVNENLTRASYASTTDDSEFSFYGDTGTDMVKIYQLPSTNEIDSVAMVLISHGPNKYGAFTAQSGSQLSTSGANTYEVSNALSSITENVAPTIDTAVFGHVTGFLSNVTIVPQNPDNDVFDDIAIYKTRLQIIQDFDLGFLLPCTSSTANYSTSYGDSTSYTFSNAYAGSLSYATAACTNDAGVTPTKKCGPNAATWIDVTTCPAS